MLLYICIALLIIITFIYVLIINKRNKEISFLKLQLEDKELDIEFYKRHQTTLAKEIKILNKVIDKLQRKLITNKPGKPHA